MGSAGRVKGKWIFRGDESSREPLGPAGSGAYFPRGAAFQREWLNLEVIKTPWLMETHWGAKEFMSTSPSPRTLLIFYFSTYECIWLPPPVNNLGEMLTNQKMAKNRQRLGREMGGLDVSTNPQIILRTAFSPGLCMRCGVLLS